MPEKTQKKQVQLGEVMFGKKKEREEEEEDEDKEGGEDEDDEENEEGGDEEEGSVGLDRWGVTSRRRWAKPRARSMR